MDVGEAFSLIAHALDTGHAAHGYLLVGDLKGSCADLTRRILEKLFPDEHAQVDANGHPDVAWLEPEGKKRIISVNAMREKIVEPMALASFSGGWKVGVIAGADRMEPPSANAFLKSLEEPTPQTLYLLLTDQPNAILPTIVSRTQRLDLPLSESGLKGDDCDEIASALATRNASALAAKLSALKGEAEDADAPLVRKDFFRTLMSIVRRPMVEGTLPLYRAFRNVEAVEDAYRQCGRLMSEEAVLSFMLDRLVLPEPADGAAAAGERRAT